MRRRLLATLALLFTCAGTAHGSATLVPTPRDPSVVTLQDNGARIVLRVGRSFTLRLGQGFQWRVRVSDSRLLARTRRPVAAAGVQGVYRAKEVGRTTLHAVGSLPCHEFEPPCLAPELLFHVTVVVGR